MASQEEHSSRDEKLKNKSLQSVGPFLGSGIQLATAVVLMYFVGTWIDGKFDSKPWGMIVCLFFGCAAGLYLFIRDAIRFGNQEQKKKL